MIDIYPVTNQQYKAFIEAGGYENEKLWDTEGWDWRMKNNITLPAFWDDEKWNSPSHPVVGVSFYEAQAYARSQGKRLPNELEWERAARGAEGNAYPWGNQFDPEKCNTKESGSGKTSRVTRYPNGVSPSGCYDMVGNVWEWTDGKSESSATLPGGAWERGQTIHKEPFQSVRHLLSPGIRPSAFDAWQTMGSQRFLTINVSRLQPELPDIY